MAVVIDIKCLLEGTGIVKLWLLSAEMYESNFTVTEFGFFDESVASLFPRIAYGWRCLATPRFWLFPSALNSASVRLIATQHVGVKVKLAQNSNVVFFILRKLEFF